MKATNPAEILSLLGEGLERERVIEPDSAASRQAISDVIAAWRDEATTANVPITVAYVTGGYDVAHINHYWYLLNVRMQAAKVWCERGGLEWQPIAEEAKRALLASELIRLVVGVDGDQLLDQRKGHRPQNGNVPRPIYPWPMRALDVAGMTFTVPTLASDLGRFTRPVADLVIAQDPFKYQGSAYADKFKVVEALHPDVWCVYREQWGQTRAALADGPALECRVVPIEDVDYYLNPRTGQPFGTSELVKQIRGQ